MLQVAGYLVIWLFGYLVVGWLAGWLVGGRGSGFGGRNLTGLQQAAGGFPFLGWSLPVLNANHLHFDSR